MFARTLRPIALAGLLCLAGLAAGAAPERYRLDADRSQVGFVYRFQDAMQRGRMPVKSAEMLIDFAHLPASRVDVTLDARAARAGFLFATEAMKSASVLDTARFPEISFRSTAISGSLSGATVAGDLTVRGVTRPVVLNARVYRQHGTASDDLSRLSVVLTGTISRAAFGADGYEGFVGDRIDLHIVARIRK